MNQGETIYIRVLVYDLVLLSHTKTCIIIKENTFEAGQVTKTIKTKI